MTAKSIVYRVATEGVDLKREFREAGDAGAAAFARVHREIDQTNTALSAGERQLQRWKAEAQAAKLAMVADTNQATINRVLGVGGGSGKSARDSAAAFEELLPPELRSNVISLAQARAAKLSLVRQGADVFTMAGLGAGPGAIAISQGPQIIDALAMSGVRLTGAMVAAGAAVTGVVLAVGGAAAAQASYEASVRKVEMSLAGLGRTSGIAVEQLEDIARTGAQTGEISVRAAREMEAAYLATGRIGGSVMSDLIGLTRDYAAATGQDAAAATKELGAAFANPIKGAEDLNARLNFLSASEREHIQNLARAGDAAGAQRAMVDALRRSIDDAANSTSGWDRILATLGRTASDAWNAVGEFIDRANGGGTDLQQLASLRERINSIRTVGVQFGAGEISRDPRLIASAIAPLERQVAEIEARLARGRQQAATAAANAASEQRQALIDGLNPGAAQLRELQAERANLVRLGVTDEASRKALSTLDAQIKALSEGYGSAAARASALSKAENEREAAARKALREREEAARELEAENEARQRRRQQYTDTELEGRIAVNRILGISTERLEQEVRFRQLSNEYQAGGLDFAKARAAAEAQVRREVEATAEAKRRELPALKPVVVPDRIMNIEPLQDQKIRLVAEAMDQLRWSGERALDRIGDLAVEGELKWKSWGDAGVAAIKDVGRELFQLAAINPLKNALFGGSVNGGVLPTLGGGLLGRVFGSIFGGASIPRNANGTDYWDGVESWVGEQGPERVIMPRGARVIPASKAASRPAGGGVVAQVSIAIDARGAGPREVEALAAQMAELRGALPSLIVTTVAEAQESRLLRSA